MLILINGFGWVHDVMWCKCNTISSLRRTGSLVAKTLFSMTVSVNINMGEISIFEKEVPTTLGFDPGASIWNNGVGVQLFYSTNIQASIG